MSDSGKRGQPTSVREVPATVMNRGETSCSGKRDVCLALVIDTNDRARLRDALAASLELRFVTSVSDVLAILRLDESPVRVVILDPRDASGRPSAGLARQVTQLFPGIPVIGYCHSGAEHSRDIVGLASAGVHELLFKRDGSAAVVRTVLAAAQRVSAADLVLARVEPIIPPRLRPLVQHILANPAESHTVMQVARAMGVHRKTLVNHCRAEGVAAPSKIIAWCLLLLAAALLAAPGATVEHVAMRLEFASATALRNMLRRHTGLRPRDLRSADGTRRLLERFARLLDATRGAEAVER